VIHAAMLLVMGAGMLAWRPCRAAEGRAPRAAVAMLMAGAAAVWVSSFALVVAAVTGELGSPVEACGILWRQIVAGDVGWWRSALLALWLAILPLRSGWELAPTLRCTRRLKRRLLSAGRPLPGRPNVTLVSGLGTTAVTVGTMRPVILVDEEFWDAAGMLERAVVIDHEDAHRRGRHGILDLVARFLTVPLPCMSDVYECVRRHLEALADDVAVRTHGRQAVGAALGRIALAGYPSAGLGAAGAAVWRVQRLVAPSRKGRWRDRLLLSGAAAGLVVAIVEVAAETALALGPVADPAFCHL
jgi:hypothetical protein